MLFASDENRDAVAQGLGWVVELVLGNWLWFVGVAVLLYLLAQASTLFGREKICWRCKGKGYRRAILGGVNRCGTCGGKGIRARVGR